MKKIVRKFYALFTDRPSLMAYGLWLMAVVVSLLTSCNQETNFKRVTVEGKYSIELPDYMEAWMGKQAEASLKYKNEERDVYTIVIDESKKELKNYNLSCNLDAYFKKVCGQSPIQSIDQARFGVPVKRMLKAGQACISDISGKVNNFPVGYRLAVVETENRFYQILSWTHADNKDAYSSDFDHLLESLRE